MPQVSHTAQDMIAGMTPILRAGVFVFASTDDPMLATALAPDAVATFAEAEGTSLILPIERAKQAGLNSDHPMRCITLKVYSSLEGVGLTAAVAAALGDVAIPCNMVAAYHHDHVFVPLGKCNPAMEVLSALQDRAAQRT